MFEDVNLRPTARDKDGQVTRAALTELSVANDIRRTYDAALTLAIGVYGDVEGTPTAGIYNPDFPEIIKNTLRHYLRELNDANDRAIALWRKAGRRFKTLRPYYQAARELPNGRQSYY